MTCASDLYRLSIACFVLQFFGLIGGRTMFYDRLNATHSLLHFLGGVLVAFYIVDVWPYTAFWAIEVFCSFLPAALEAFVLMCRRHS